MDTKNPLWANAKLNVQFVEQGLTEEKQQINWIKPNFDYEWEEIEFQANEPNVPADVRAYMNRHFPDKEAWLQAVQHGRPVTVSPNHKYKINNYPNNKEDLQYELSPLSDDPGGPDKEKRVNALFAKGGNIEMPIILNTGKQLWLVGGKTRLGTANYIKGIPAKVWMIGVKEGVAEAFDQNYMTGHCHVMALALKMKHPKIGRAHV